MTQDAPHTRQLGWLQHDLLDRVPESIGGRTLVRRLSDSRFGSRFLARDPRRDTDCTVWQFEHVAGDQGPTLWEYLKRNAGVRRPHTLTIEAAGRDRDGCWAVTPYVGNHDGVVTLEELCAAREGAMSLFETGRAIDQLLEASAHAHRAGIQHGEIDPACVLVNPRGTLEIAMYGLQHALEGTAVAEDAVQQEIRSVGLIASRMLSGAADESQTADRPRTGSALRAWVLRACDPIDGFETAADAIAALPARHDESTESRLGAAKSLLGRISAVVATGRAKPQANGRKKTEVL